MIIMKNKAFIAAVAAVSLILPAAASGAPTAVFQKDGDSKFSVMQNENFDIEIVLQDCPEIKSIYLYDLAYDADLITINDQEWLLENALASDVDGAEPYYVLNTSNIEYIDANTSVFRINCTAASIEDEFDKAKLAYTIQINTADGNVLLESVPAVVTIRSYQRGDIDRDGDVDIDDAIYLVRHIFLPDRYPI